MKTRGLVSFEFHVFVNVPVRLSKAKSTHQSQWFVDLHLWWGRFQSGCQRLNTLRSSTTWAFVMGWVPLQTSCPEKSGPKAPTHRGPVQFGCLDSHEEPVIGFLGWTIKERE